MVIAHTVTLTHLMMVFTQVLVLKMGLLLHFAPLLAATACDILRCEMYFSTIKSLNICVHIHNQSIHGTGWHLAFNYSTAGPRLEFIDSLSLRQNYHMITHCHQVTGMHH